MILSAKPIRIDNVRFEVIGVMEEKGVDISGADQDDQILIPINNALRRLLNLTYINTIYVWARNSQSMDRAVTEISELLRKRHRLNRHSKPDDFPIQNQ